MATKQFNTRIQHKIDTWENWSKAENFKPLLGEIIIYTTDENGNENVKIKIGDGETVVHSLPFAVGGSATDEPGLAQIQSDWAQTDSTQPDYIKNKIGDYQKDLREFNDITFGNYAGTRPFYMWNNVLSNIDTLKDLDEEVILNVYQNGNLIDSQKFVLNPTLDSSFLPSSGQTGYWVLINATKTTEEILGGSAWEKKNPDYSTFNMGFIKNDTTGIVYVIAGAPNDELVGQSFSFKLDFTNITKQLIKLPWEVISNKPGDTITTIVSEDVINIENLQDVVYEEDAGCYIWSTEYGSDEEYENRGNIIGKEVKISIRKPDNSELNIYTTEALPMYEGEEDAIIYFNTIQNFEECVANGIPKNDSTIPAFFILFGDGIALYASDDLTGYDIKIYVENTDMEIIGLPETTLGEEFENIDGKLTLTLGKTITTTTEINNSYATTLGTPSATSPFLIWNNVVKDKQIYDDIQEGTPVKITYIQNGETGEFDVCNVFKNSTLDTQFGMGSNNTGYYGFINAAQSLEEVLTQGVWTRADSTKPTFTLVFAKSNTTGQSQLQIAAPESLTDITFTIEISTTETESKVIKLSKEALPDDLQVQSDYAENDETKDSYIQNRPFYDYPVQKVNFPRTFEKITWDGNTEEKTQMIEIENEIQTPSFWYKISNNFISEEKLLNSFITINSTDLGEDNIRLVSQISPISNIQTGTTGYEISSSIDGNTLISFIYEAPEAGTYSLISRDVQCYFPEAGIYVIGTDETYIKSWEGFYDLDSEELIKAELQSGFFTTVYFKYITEEIPEREDWYYSYLKPIEIYNYKVVTNSTILDDISILEDLHDKYGSYSVPPLILVIKTSNESIEILDGTFITFEKTGIYMAIADMGDNHFMAIDSYQLYNKIDKKYTYPVEIYNEIEYGNTKPVSSGAVWTALGERSSICIDDENLPQSGSQSLMTSNAIYKAFDQMDRNKQDNLLILNIVLENSDGIVQSSGIYNAIKEVKDNIPTTTNQLTNDSNFINKNQLDSAVQEVMNVANGKRASYVFKDINELNTFIASNQDNLKIGDIFLLTDTDLPDYWWTGSDIAVLETDIDLDNYYNQSQVNNLLSQKADAGNHYTKTEIDSQISQNLGGLMFRKAYSSQISNPTEGTIYYNTNNKTIQTYSGGSWSSAVAADPNTIYFVVEG